MKEAAILDIGQCLSRLESFDTIIDVRSPSEYAEDRIPGAINAPVLDDAQRIRVGTLYKQVGAFEAKRVGGALVARNIADHIEQRFAGQPRTWRALIYCWRGGNRSGAMATVMSNIGWPVTLIDGGYRAFRRHVNLSLAQLPARFEFCVIAGRTGSGKSAVLRALDDAGAQTLDLEAIANHRGSVLGSMPDGGQPSQKHFETEIWHRLSRFDPARPVFVESESKKVGQNHVPEALIEHMRSSRCVALETSIHARIDHLIGEYEFLIANPGLLVEKLDYLRPLHGAVRIEQWQGLIASGHWRELVEDLLTRHYDPSYDRSMRRNFKQIDHARQIRIESSDSASLEQAAKELLEFENATMR